MQDEDRRYISKELGIGFCFVKIGVHDTRHDVSINFTKDDDSNLLWYKRVIEIQGL